MKEYPSIEARVNKEAECYVFDKLDGSNIRAEWTRKTKSFVKFGSRNRLLGDDQGKIAGAAQIISDKFLKDLNEVFIDERYERAIAFFEFYGPNSFAGNHPDEVSQMTATLFDIAPYKKGIIAPNEFMKLYGHVDVPKVLHRGRVGEELIQMVKSSKLPGMTFEGVVCKGPYDRRLGGPIMFKVKSFAWLNKLKTYCDGNEDLYRRLA